jgi:hypothetical protein
MAEALRVLTIAPTINAGEPNNCPEYTRMQSIIVVEVRIKPRYSKHTLLVLCTAASQPSY